MNKLRLEKKIIDYLNRILSDESLFEYDDGPSYCQYYFVDRENNIEVILTDYSYFYDGNWQFHEQIYLTMNKIKTYYGDGTFWTEELINSKKWAIPYKLMFKASKILNKKQKEASKNYRARVSKENCKRSNIAKEFAVTLPNSPKIEKKSFWASWF